MNDFIERKVNEWAQNDPEIREVNFRIIHLERRLFRHYTPQKRDESFFFRLKNWLGNVANSNDQKILFQIVPQLFFIGPQELESLYRTAYNVEFGRWLIDQISLDVTKSDAQQELQSAIVDTWFCPITDSFIINDFFKVNNIPSKLNLRPDWHSLTALGDINSIISYVTHAKIRRIVMLEDFVGSGSQVASRISFACENFPKIEILCITLINCPVGIKALNDLIKLFPNLTVKNVIEIPSNYLIELG